MATQDDPPGPRVSGVTAGRDVVVTLVGGGAGIVATSFVLALLVGLLTYPAQGAALVAVGAFVLSAGLMLSIIHRSNMGQVISGGLGSFLLVKGHGLGGATLVGLGAAGAAFGGAVAGDTARGSFVEEEAYVGFMHIPNAAEIADEQRKYRHSRGAAAGAGAAVIPAGVVVEEPSAEDVALAEHAPTRAGGLPRPKRAGPVTTLLPAPARTPALIGLGPPRIVRETGALLVELPGVVVDAAQLEVGIEVQLHDLADPGPGPGAVRARSAGKYRGADGLFVASAYHRVASGRVPLSVMKVLVPLAELGLPPRPTQRLAVTATVFVGGAAGPRTLLGKAPVGSFEIRARTCGAEAAAGEDCATEPAAGR